MALLTASEVGGWWESEGGPKSRVVEFVAISMAESGLNDTAVSVTDAIGLWQVEPEHAAEYGFQVSGLYEPQVNAYIAVRLSGYGSNCAAWDTCYLDIYSSGRYSFLGFPEQGSAAYNNLAAAANLLGKNPPYTRSVAPPTVVGQDLPNALARWGELGTRQIPALSAAMLRQRAHVHRLYTG